jgi:hypothetical protein
MDLRSRIDWPDVPPELFEQAYDAHMRVFRFFERDVLIALPAALHNPSLLHHFAEASSQALLDLPGRAKHHPFDPRMQTPGGRLHFRMVAGWPRKFAPTAPYVRVRTRNTLELHELRWLRRLRHIVDGVPAGFGGPVTHVYQQTECRGYAGYAGCAMLANRLDGVGRVGTRPCSNSILIDESNINTTNQSVQEIARSSFAEPHRRGAPLPPIWA